MVMKHIKQTKNRVAIIKDTVSKTNHQRSKQQKQNLQNANRIQSHPVALTTVIFTKLKNKLFTSYVHKDNGMTVSCNIIKHKA
jgi:hypothetical protein